MLNQMKDQLETIKHKAHGILSIDPKTLDKDGLEEARGSVKNILQDFKQHINNIEVFEQNTINKTKEELKNLQNDLALFKDNSPKKAQLIQLSIIKRTEVLALRMKEMVDVQELKTEFNAY